MPNNVKTYDGTRDLEDHVKKFQAAAQVERWAMPTWCHIFNSAIIGTARVWFDELLQERLARIHGLNTAFLAYLMTAKRMAPECMRVSGFMHGVNNPELKKSLNEHVLKAVEEMMTVTTAFIRGETVAASKKKGHAPWKQHDQPKRHVSERKNRFQKSDSKLCPCQRNYVPTTDYQQGDRRSACYRSGNWRTHDPPHPKLGGNIEVYVDDLVIKSYTEAEMLRDIDETLCTLQRINMKLNPKKYTFGAVEGMFLGYMISPEGIKPCPDKTEDVLFLTKSVEKSLPLFKTLKNCIKKSDFHWTPKTEQAFKQLKQHLSELPLLVAPKPKEELIVYLSTSHGAISAVLMTERGTVQTSVYFFTASNNEAEYEALIAGLRIAAQIGVCNVQVSVDSKLVANQVLGTYVSKEENMVEYLEKAKNMISGFANFSISQVPRSKNKKADTLSKITSTSFTHLSKQVLVEVLKEKSIHEEEVVTVVEEEGPTWMTPIIEYLKDKTLPDDRKEASKHPNYVIREIQEGLCSMHAGPRSVVAKAMQLGYYWPTMHWDARDMICTCNDCQIHHPVPRNPQQPLTPITALWSFYKWGIDIGGPFPKGPGKVKFLIVAMDYFTKWIEAKAVATITSNQVKKFVWDIIVCRFGLPGEIVSDNGKQFSDNPFKDWCEKLNITQRFASMKHPHSNGLVERANRSLGEGIKARLGEVNKNWIEELPHVLWAHRMMIKSSHDTVHNDEELRLNLDLLEERHERAAIREAKAKLKITKYYNARVRGVTFRPGDFIYCSNEASHAMDGRKLGQKWEVPYEVTEALGDGAYKLRSMDGAILPRT
ncbi:reverse transcriptase domain-containing protein [Tanacetum coccineum]|uniref:Reverse transcriptase domain-containing protein n=1 Tax=Tanacetum coccineum TaxID=301880 RepID=A0ABQ4YI66_9ASTR